MNGYCPILGAIQLKLSKIRTESMQRHNYNMLVKRTLRTGCVMGCSGTPPRTAKSAETAGLDCSGELHKDY